MNGDGGAIRISPLPPSVATKKLSFSPWLKPKNSYYSLQIFLPESSYFKWKCYCHSFLKLKMLGLPPYRHHCKTENH